MKIGDLVTIKRLYILKQTKDCKGPDYKVGDSITIESIENTKVTCKNYKFPIFTWQLELKRN